MVGSAASQQEAFSRFFQVSKPSGLCMFCHTSQMLAASLVKQKVATK